jgi:hypothetical protein
MGIKNKLESLSYEDIEHLISTLHARDEKLIIGKRSISFDIAKFSDKAIRIITVYLSHISSY